MVEYGLLSKFQEDNACSICSKNLNRYRDVLGMKSVKDMPKTFQYFNEKLDQIYSQFDQDGIIQAIFELIGTTNMQFVEIGGGSKNDNTMLLRSEKGWNGYLFNNGGYFMDQRSEEMTRKEWVSQLNVNQIFEKYNVQQEIDLLSIDIDSNDYWVWKALDNTKFRPRVVVIEFNPNFDAGVAASIPDHNPYAEWQNNNKFFGASIKAMFDLAKQKGYEYVYHMSFTDVFFVRSDLLNENMKGMDIKDTFDPLPLHYMDGMNGQKFQIIK